MASPEDLSKLENVGTLRHAVLLAIIWSCFGGALLIVTGRTAVRLKIAKRPSAEDYWVLFALAALLALCVLETIQLPSLYYMTAVLEGKVAFSMSMITYSETYLRYQFPITCLYWTVLWSIKAGFLALYFKLFKELTIYRRVWYGLAVFTLLAYAACWASLAVSCGTLDNFFRFNQCSSEQSIWMSNFNVYLSTSVDVFTDLCSKLFSSSLSVNHVSGLSADTLFFPLAQSWLCLCASSTTSRSRRDKRSV